MGGCGGKRGEWGYGGGGLPGVPSARLGDEGRLGEGSARPPPPPLSPQGTDVYPLLSTALHDPAMFRFPDSFNPANFLDGSGRFQKNDAFVPFSSGTAQTPPT